MKEDDWTRPLGYYGISCAYPNCSAKVIWKKRLFWSDYELERQMNLCKTHNLCAVCGKTTDWDPALCWDCHNAKIMLEIKCIEPGCTRNKPQGAAKKQLSRCQDHNPCAKCGKTFAWKDLLCRKCDVEYKCAFPNCKNLPIAKASTETREGFGGPWMSFQRREELTCCFEHNICSKCDDETDWDEKLCRKCDV